MCMCDGMHGAFNITCKIDVSTTASTTASFTPSAFQQPLPDNPSC